MQVVSGTDDDVFGSARDEKLTVGDVAEIASLEPAVVPEPARGSVVVEVALRRRGSAAGDRAFVSFRLDGAVGADDPHGVALERTAATHEAH